LRFESARRSGETTEPFLAAVSEAISFELVPLSVSRAELAEAIKEELPQF